MIFENERPTGNIGISKSNIPNKRLVYTYFVITAVKILFRKCIDLGLKKSHVKFIIHVLNFSYVF